MNAIEIRNLSKSFSRFSLEDINLTLPSGCIMGLVGENGAGKSTLFKLILGILRKKSGTATLLGTDDLLLAKQDIGVVLDDVGIPPALNAFQVGNIMRNIFKNWDSALYYSYLERFSIPTDTPFKEYSRGMKMKLGFAIALSHGAKLLLLDEATAGLDPVVRDEIVEILLDFTRQEDHSVLISSHIVSDLEKLCDYIAFLHKGKLLLCEEKDALLRQYAILHCSAEQLAALSPEAIKRKKETSYGVEAIVLRDAIPNGFPLSPISIEELFVFMCREAI